MSLSLSQDFQENEKHRIGNQQKIRAGSSVSCGR